MNAVKNSRIRGETTKPPDQYQRSLSLWVHWFSEQPEAQQAFDHLAGFWRRQVVSGETDEGSDEGGHGAWQPWPNKSRFLPLDFFFFVF